MSSLELLTYHLAQKRANLSDVQQHRIVVVPELEVNVAAWHGQYLQRML